MKYLIIGLLTFSLLPNLYAHEGDEEVEVKNAPRFGGLVVPLESADHNEEDEHKHGHAEEKKEPKHSEKEKHHDQKEEGKDKHANEEHHDEPAHGNMAEIIISDEGVIRLYIYDGNMKEIPLTEFSNFANVNLSFKKSKVRHAMNFSIKKESKYYKGDLPKVGKKPFTLEIELSKLKVKHKVLFKNLD